MWDMNLINIMFYLPKNFITANIKASNTQIWKSEIQEIS